MVETATQIIARKAKEAKAKKEAESAQSQAMKALQEQVSGLTTELQEARAQHKVEMETLAKKAEAEQEKSAAEEAAKLEADKDIQSLLSMDTSNGSDEADDEDDDTGREKKQLSQAEMLTTIGTAVETALNANTKMLEDKFTAALEESKMGTKKLTQYLMQREAAAQIESTQKEFSDFDDYKDEIGKIMATANVTVRDAYLMAKGRKASTAPAASETISEKPTSLANRVQLAEKRKEERSADEQAPKGRVGFKQLLSAAADKVVAERTHQ